MLQPRQRLGDFEIIRLLGKGGMGEVYEAQQFHPERRVALKVLAPWLADNQQALDRFWREANVPAKLDHPSIVRIIQTDKVDKIAYYTMQLVRGISLSDLMRTAAKAPDPLDKVFADGSQTESNGAVPANQADTVTVESPLPSVVEEYRRDRFGTLARIGADAARALDSAHRQGFLHRDIKPSNLMVDHHSQLYLVDFGLTRALDSTTGTRAGTVIGTPWFMSPEQAQGQPLDARSDIFSLGVTLYQLATGGKGPYESRRGDTDAVLREVRSGTLRPIAELAPETPAAVAHIITRATAAKPEDRYQTASDLAVDLETFLASGTVPRVPSVGAAQSRSRYWLIGAAVLIVVAGVAVGLFRDPGEKERKATEKLVGDGVIRVPFQRDRPFGTKVNLLRVDNQPIEHRVMVGNGAISALPSELVLRGDGEQPFVVALDHPTGPGYEFAIECKTMGQTADRTADMGIFFGWREKLADRMAQMRFFALKVDSRPIEDDLHGRLYIGTWQFNPPAAGAGIREQDMRLLTKKKWPGWMPLSGPERLKEKDWHPVRVTVRGQQFTVAVDDEPEQTIIVGSLVKDSKFLAAFSLDCHGLIGIWVRNGTGHFRNATIMAVPIDPE
jgi:serine/threonine protein kinase